MYKLANFTVLLATTKQNQEYQM